VKKAGDHTTCPPPQWGGGKKESEKTNPISYLISEKKREFHRRSGNDFKSLEGQEKKEAKICPGGSDFRGFRSVAFLFEKGRRKKNSKGGRKNPPRVFFPLSLFCFTKDLDGFPLCFVRKKRVFRLVPGGGVVFVSSLFSFSCLKRGGRWCGGKC